MIDLALKSGQKDTIDASAAARLGLGAAAVPRKWVAYPKDAAPDKKERAFSIVPDENPGALIMSVWGTAGTQLTLFKAALDGTLQLAIRCKGNLGDKNAPPVALELDAKATREEFERELAFYEKDAAGLDPKIDPKREPKRGPKIESASAAESEPKKAPKGGKKKA